MATCLVDCWGRPIAGGYDALGPLTFVDVANQRGRSAVLAPKNFNGCIDNVNISKGEAQLISTYVQCARGQLLGVVLGLSVHNECPPKNGCFIDHSVRAVLQWGLGGVPLDAECDWINGTQISLVAETVKVTARYVTRTLPWALECDSCPPIFNVSAGVGYSDNGVNSNPARLTELVQIQNPGGTFDLPLPPFGISFTIQLVKPTTSAAFEILGSCTGYGVPGVTLGPLTNVGMHSVENSFPIRNGARFLRFTNTNVAGPLLAFVIFGMKF